MKVQARITLPPEARREVDALRNRWNPERAEGNPAHVTVVYHDEAPDPALLADRLRAAAARVRPFLLILGRVEKFAEPLRGAYLTVADPSGGVAAIREHVLIPPFTRRSRFGLHVTLLHPDQGSRLESAWPDFEGLPPVGPFEAAELQIVGPGNEVISVIRMSALNF